METTPVVPSVDPGALDEDKDLEGDVHSDPIGREVDESGQLYLFPAEGTTVGEAGTPQDQQLIEDMADLIQKTPVPQRWDPEIQSEDN